MAIDPESLLSTPSGYASPQQIQSMYAIAKALLGNQPQQMQSWLQPMAQIANAGLAGKYLNSAKAAQQANAAAGLPLGSSSQPQQQPQQLLSQQLGIDPFIGLFGGGSGGS